MYRGKAESMNILTVRITENGTLSDISKRIIIPCLLSGYTDVSDGKVSRISVFININSSTAIFNSTPPEHLTYDEGAALKLAAEGKRDKCEEYLLERLVNFGYIKKAENNYIPNLVVFDGYDTDKYWRSFKETERKGISETANKIRVLLADACSYANQITKEDLPPLFRDNENMRHVACCNSRFGREYVLKQALRDGWLKYDQNTSVSVGACLYI